MNNFKVALADLNDEVVPDWVSDALAREGIDLVFQHCTTQEELLWLAGDADVVWLKGGSRVITAGCLQELPRCGAILRTGSGTDNVPVEEATRLGILVAHTPDAHSDEVSDHAIALLLAVVRQVARQDRGMRAGRWLETDAKPLSQIRRKTLGLVGFGRVSRLVAQKMSGFDLSFQAYDPYVDPASMTAAGVRPATLDEVLSESDFVSLHSPLTKETHHLIGERELRMMRRGAFLLNTSRGQVIDEPALVRALAEGWIAGAGLDTFYEEPTPADNPLLKLDNVVATPHVAGYSDRHSDATWRLSTETVIDLSKGRVPNAYVNQDVKPRMRLSPQ